jgi:hypothetical protein
MTVYFTLKYQVIMAARGFDFEKHQNFLASTHLNQMP